MVLSRRGVARDLLMAKAWYNRGGAASCKDLLLPPDVVKEVLGSHSPTANRRQDVRAMNRGDGHIIATLGHTMQR